MESQREGKMGKNKNDYEEFGRIIVTLKSYTGSRIIPLLQKSMLIDQDYYSSLSSSNIETRLFETSYRVVLLCM